jgi:hypothetical protein
MFGQLHRLRYSSRSFDQFHDEASLERPRLANLLTWELEYQCGILDTEAFFPRRISAQPTWQNNLGS